MHFEQDADFQQQSRGIYAEKTRQPIGKESVSAHEPNALADNHLGVLGHTQHVVSR